MHAEHHAGVPLKSEQVWVIPRVGLTRGKRIALEVLGPPALGVVVMLVPAMVWEAAQTMARGGSMHVDVARAAYGFAYWLFAAYVMMGIPSILFAAVMECAFARGLNPQSWWAVGLATGLGGGAGCGVTAIPSALSSGIMEWSAIAAFTATGIAVGFLLGALIRWASKPRARK
ncbi:MAG: hypothetical protein NTV51_28820 [Verrucomicrobia bacterium]|nr:hypothetical protein [Verrucomicrobiota bacterium]